MIDYKEKMLEEQEKYDFYTLSLIIKQFDKRVEDNLRKIKRLEKDAEKLTNLSPDDVLKYITNVQRELAYMKKKVATFYSAYAKLRSFVISKTDKQ